MTIINAKKCLNKNKLDEFMSVVNNQDEFIDVVFDEDNEIHFSGTLKTLQEIFKNQLLIDTINIFGDSTEISIIAKNATMQITGADVVWWSSPRRFQKLFGTSTEKPITKKDTIYKIAIGIRKDNSVTDIETFEGNQKQMTAFINKLFQRNYIRSFGRCITVFCINYKYDDDLNNINNWHTMEDLIESGDFIK